MSDLSRRKFIITAGTAAAGTVILHGCGGSSGDQPSSGASSPSAAPASVSAADAPETTKARLGFIALTDSAPLIIAKEKGFFDKYGMKDVEVAKQASWAATRDNIVLGSDGGGIDGAHILTPMPYLISTGAVTNGKKVPMYILARLNTNGQCISVANTYKDLKVNLQSTPLKDAFAKAKAAGKDTKCAVTFPGGTHDLWMRYWLSAGGIDPDKDASTIVVPPPQMVANMKVGNMEAFCVGEPWNAQLVNQGLGYTAFTTGELWKDHPEKAFSMRADYVDKHPKAAKALLMAVLEAQMWCDKMENKEEMCNILSKREWFKVPAKDIVERAKGKFDYGDGRVEENSPYLMKFWSDSASYPYASHDLWFLTEDIRWGYLPADTDSKALVKAVNREDLWKDAAKAIGQEAAIPKSTSRGIETFFDGVKFDPENPEAYLKSLKIKKVKA
ncbi:bicarbonate-binding protein [Leptolyngbya sp. 'hensonii']|uniref:CmpA/NrtA family ABC transporter substrate-binding protein n=1 Tax=Leptolyngbya sp. 'hensonii' TaxID=1922337 RepID=UPI00094FC26C|nr:CmpA/NrtA family ABC transporter substrate-binding protein [Leptolyngbya sp. 'hensonii']OLP18059.1 bicarbonate-binding protein [Leptolyngbya sp. 'hensonii']